MVNQDSICFKLSPHFKLKISRFTLVKFFYTSFFGTRGDFYLRRASFALECDDSAGCLAIIKSACRDSQLGAEILKLVHFVYLRGDPREAFLLLESYLVTRADLAKKNGLDGLGLRVFPKGIFSPIGHTGLLDIFVKAKILGFLSEDLVITGFTKEFVSPTLLSLYEPHFAAVIGGREGLVIENIFESCVEIVSLVRLEGEYIPLAEFGRLVQLEWERRNLRALCSFPAFLEQRCRTRMTELGLPENAWFVTLHVRESGEAVRGVRDCSIESYGLLIAEVVGRGGWVVRIGDKNMTDYKVDGLISLTNEQALYETLTIYAIAKCRFFVGTGSGPIVIPRCFGIRSLASNWGPLASRQWGADEILLPKEYRDNVENRSLTLAERVTAKFGYSECCKDLDEKGVSVIDNSPEELWEAVIEMFNFDKPVDPLTVKCQTFADEISNAHKLYPIRFAKSFLNAQFQDPKLERLW